MRLTPIAPEELSDEQRALHKDMRDGIERHYQGFVAIRQDGALLGPWNAWLHEPKIGGAIWALTKTMSAQSVLPDRCRQVAILVTGAHFRAGYEIYAHTAVAVKDGLAEETVATIVAGQRPADLPREQAIAYDVAAALVSGGVLPEISYNLARHAFGQHGLNELIYLVGLYTLVSVTLNGFDIPIPDSR